MTARDPLWLSLLAYALGALAVGLFGWVIVRGASLVFLDALSRLL